MKERIHGLLLLLVVLQPPCIGAAEDQGIRTFRSFTYEKVLEITPSSVSGGSGGGITLQIGTKAYISFEDMLIPAKVCDSGRYECFESCRLAFAIPKLASRITNTWESGGHEYKLIKYYDTYLARGRKIRDVHVIEGQIFHCTQGWDSPHVIQKDAKRLFYYSTNIGLLGFADFSSEQGGPAVALYLLDGVCGFASSSECMKKIGDEAERK